MAIPVPKGTVSIMLSTTKKTQSFVEGQKLSESARFKLKWKTVEWLIANKKEAVEYMSKEKQLLWYKYCILHSDVIDNFNLRDGSERKTLKIC